MSTYNNIKPLVTNFSITGSNLIIMIFSVLLFLLIGFVYGKMNLSSANCESIIRANKDNIKITSVNNTGYPFKDYYVKTAYNACSSGQFKNDFVNLCALENVIKQGARCIDLEIYSLDNEPVIAASSVDNYNIKETYNSVKFGDALTLIRENAFSGSTCSNPRDPIILHLRIMSNNKTIYDKIAALIDEILYDKTMGPSYSYEKNGEDFGNILLEKLMGKVVIIVDKSNNNPLVESKLYEYVNMTSGTVFMRKLRYSADVKYAPDKDELKTYNKENISIVLPDISHSNANYSAKTAIDCGCQFIAMCFQNLDIEMELYNEFFTYEGCAFILKDKAMRSNTTVKNTVTTINNHSNTELLSLYEPRTVTGNHYKFVI